MQPQQVNEANPVPKVQFLDPIQIYEAGQQVQVYDQSGTAGFEIKNCTQPPVVWGYSSGAPLKNASQTVEFSIPVGGPAMLQSKNSFFKMTHQLDFLIPKVANQFPGNYPPMVIAVGGAAEVYPAIGERIALSNGFWTSTPLYSQVALPIANAFAALDNCNYSTMGAKPKIIATGPLNAAQFINSIYVNVGGSQKLIEDFPAIVSLLQAQIPQEYQDTIKATFFNSENIISFDVVYFKPHDFADLTIAANRKKELIVVGDIDPANPGWSQNVNLNQTYYASQGYSLVDGDNAHFRRTVFWDTMIPMQLLPMFDQADSLFQTNLLSYSPISIKFTTRNCSVAKVYGPPQRWTVLPRNFAPAGGLNPGDYTNQIVGDTFIASTSGIVDWRLVYYQTVNQEMAQAMMMIQTQNRNNFTWYDIATPPTQNNVGSQLFQLSISTKSLRYNAFCARPTDQNADDSLYYHGFLTHMTALQAIQQQNMAISNYIHWINFKVARGGSSDQIFVVPINNLQQCIYECRRTFGYLQQYRIGTSKAFSSELEYLTKFHIVCVNYESFALLNEHPVQHDGINTYNAKILVNLEVGIYNGHECRTDGIGYVKRYEDDETDQFTLMDKSVYGATIISAVDYHMYFSEGRADMTDVLMP